jgi:hypothetical protein
LTIVADVPPEAVAPLAADVVLAMAVVAFGSNIEAISPRARSE